MLFSTLLPSLRCTTKPTNANITIRIFHPLQMTTFTTAIISYMSTKTDIITLVLTDMLSFSILSSFSSQMSSLLTVSINNINRFVIFTFIPNPEFSSPTSIASDSSVTILL